MVFVWSYLTDGDPAYTLVQVSLNDLIMLVLFAPIVGLLVTGLLQARRNPAFEGLFAFGTAYSLALSLKHILVLAMIGITLYRSLVLGRGQPLTPAQERLNGRLLLTNAILGGIVLLFSGIITALSTGAPV